MRIDKRIVWPRYINVVEVMKEKRSIYFETSFAGNKYRARRLFIPIGMYVVNVECCEEII